ncbi:hypothetical protein FQN60_012339 [Etheostoma spectabile]|uniref:RING-type domain-containing protein n=1 Tax=Etheostoma spectabile TaxID=54343 RepID=A0A5J5DNZ1_9PERO|nr:hypothetical protein FQN60_012339 [Etheostoma spectabile]
MELPSLCFGFEGSTSILRRNTHCKIRRLKEETTEEVTQHHKRAIKLRVTESRLQTDSVSQALAHELGSSPAFSQQGLNLLLLPWESNFINNSNGVTRFEHYCSMTSEIYHLPLNVYVIVLGIGLFVFMLSLIFCCYLFRLKQQGTREQFSYNEVVLKGASKKLSLLGQTCAVCLEEFRTRDELGVCLLKWLEIRSVCPMCNKPILRLHTDAPQGAEGPMDPEEV